MSLFKKRPPAPVGAGAAAGSAALTPAQAIQQAIQKTGQPSLFAHSEFVKQVSCARCGAPKQLPSRTAYLYCDYCGALVDYDFRMANSGTNLTVTNMVYQRLAAPVQVAMDRAVVERDAARYRELIGGVFTEWLRECPQAASPRATSDDDFRDRMVTYLVESAVSKDFDPATRDLSASLAATIATFGQRPNPGGPWLVVGDVWRAAALFKQTIELAYARMEEAGIMRLDPDEAPPGVQVRMEYSTFCQGWVPHLAPADGERMLEFFGLNGQYRRADLSAAEGRRCGGCGGELAVLPDARAVTCESCGKHLDIAGGEVPCRSCGAALSLPVGAAGVECPYCHGAAHRV
jgi:LSD1 subclass zinc finger protein